MFISKHDEKQRKIILKTWEERSKIKNEHAIEKKIDKAKIGSSKVWYNRLLPSKSDLKKEWGMRGRGRDRDRD